MCGLNFYESDVMRLKVNGSFDVKKKLQAKPDKY